MLKEGIAKLISSMSDSELSNSAQDFMKKISHSKVEMELMHGPSAELEKLGTAALYLGALEYEIQKRKDLVCWETGSKL